MEERRGNENSELVRATREHRPSAAVKERLTLSRSIDASTRALRCISLKRDVLFQRSSCSHYSLMQDNSPRLSLSLSLLHTLGDVSAARRESEGWRRYITRRVARRYGRARAETEKVRVDTCGQSTCIKLTPAKRTGRSRVRECSKARHGR